MNTQEKQAKMKTVNTKQTRKNKDWLTNKDVIKTPKLFNVQMIRNKDCSFHVLGGGVAVKSRKNQFSTSESWEPVDVRDFTRCLKSSVIRSF